MARKTEYAAVKEANRRAQREVAASLGIPIKDDLDKMVEELAADRPSAAEITALERQHAHDRLAAQLRRYGSAATTRLAYSQVGPDVEQLRRVVDVCDDGLRVLDAGDADRARWCVGVAMGILYAVGAYRWEFVVLDSKR